MGVLTHLDSCRNNNVSRTLHRAQQCLITYTSSLQVHGFPRVMGVLTHLDGFRNDDKLKKVKKALKHRFWTEIYQGEAIEGGLK
jgi:hypothetical protein